MPRNLNGRRWAGRAGAASAAKALVDPRPPRSLWPGDQLLENYRKALISSVNAPVTVMLAHSFFMALPDELAEAARVNGARPMRFFWDSLLPTN